MSKEKTINDRIKEQQAYLSKLYAVESAIQVAQQQLEWSRSWAIDTETGEYIYDENGEHVYTDPTPGDSDYSRFVVWNEVLDFLNKI